MTDKALETLEAVRPADDRLLRIEAVEDLVGLGASTIHRLIAAGRFPRKILIDGGSGASAGRARQSAARWSANEVQAWIAAQKAARDAGGNS